MAAFMDIFTSSDQNKDFKSLYRFNPNQVDWITDYFLGVNNDELRGGALGKVTKMKVFLRFVGDPGFQIGIGEDFGIHQSTVSRIVAEVAEKIVQKSENWIKFPISAEELEEAKTAWQSRFRFPSCIGVVDCTHIRICKPSQHSDEYINRKGYHSLNIQATCNAAEFITSVDVSWPGSVHDSRIFKNSSVYSLLNNGTSLLLGDEGYGITPFLMTPFRRPLTAAEKNFNVVLTRERIIIERVFGQLKQRFPCLQYKLRISTQNVPKIVVACCVLHNVAKSFMNGGESMDNIIEMQAPDETTPVDGTDRGNALQQLGLRKRNEIAAILYNQNIS